MDNQPNYQLPSREYYKLDRAASLLGCEADDLLHWGARGQIELCFMPSHGLTWIGDGSRVYPTTGETIYFSDNLVSFAKATGDDEFCLYGLWEVPCQRLAEIEHIGFISERSMFTRPSSWRRHWGKGERLFTALIDWAEDQSQLKVTPDRLFISHGELERLRSGEAAEVKQIIMDRPDDSEPEQADKLEPAGATKGFYRKLIAWLALRTGALNSPEQATIDNLSALEDDWKARGFNLDRDRVSRELREASGKIPPAGSNKPPAIANQTR